MARNSHIIFDTPGNCGPLGGYRGHARDSRLQQLAVHLYRATGAGIAIALMELLARVADEPLSRVPFVTSIVLVMALPYSPPARPYAIIGGHMFSCAAGLLAVWTLGPGETAVAVALGLALLFMLTFDALHPPAGIDAFLIAALGLPFVWVLSPVLVGTVFLVGYTKVWSAGERWLGRSALARTLSDTRLGQWKLPKIDSSALVRRALGQRRREETLPKAEDHPPKRDP